MTRAELIRGIHDLENYLSRFEEKYRLRSEDFYRQVSARKLEQSHDFIEWLASMKSNSNANICCSLSRLQPAASLIKPKSCFLPYEL